MTKRVAKSGGKRKQEPRIVPWKKPGSKVGGVMGNGKGGGSREGVGIDIELEIVARDKEVWDKDNISSSIRDEDVFGVVDDVSVEDIVGNGVHRGGSGVGPSMGVVGRRRCISISDKAMAGLKELAVAHGMFSGKTGSVYSISRLIENIGLGALTVSKRGEGS